MAVATPLKWAGSKVRLMPQLLPHLPKGKRLVEPFAGSCAVMMNTDYDEYLIADVNPDLIYMYQSIQLDVEQFIDNARGFFENSTEQQYYLARACFNLESDWQQRAAMFLYLNRHCWRGLCRYNKRGHFNVPYGHYKKPYFPESEILAFAEKSKCATFICASYEETLGMVRTGDVVYCDPPYIPVSATSSFTQYHTDGFSDADQKELGLELFGLSLDGIPVITSNSDTPETRRIYGYEYGFNIIELLAPRSIGAKEGADSFDSELLMISDASLVAS